MQAYNHNVTRCLAQPLYLAVCFVLLSSACNRAAENKEAVKQGIVQHLQKNAALDVSQLNIDITNVRFQGNEATASVAINPKSAPNQGMNMTYTLDRRGDKWEVRGRGAGHGGAMGGDTSGGMLGGMGQDGSGSGQLPPGHPSSGSGTNAGSLPPGHPPVNAPAPQGK